MESLEQRVLLSASSTRPSLSVSPADDPSGSPTGLSPAMIEQAYGFTNLAFKTGGNTYTADGAGETIAIVDAFADPNISSDLQTFDANFGLPNNNPSGHFVLTVATPEGTVSTDAGWATEESLDVEWAHAIAPEANIILVEASGANTTALTEAVVWAAQQPGVAAISMSFGNSPEFAGETAYDGDFTTPSGHSGVTFVAASGDDGEPNYPSTSPNVLAVGGTTLIVDNSGNWTSESPWSGSGGGLSPYEGTQKPDVAYDGDPDTGFLVYDSIPYQGMSGWQVVGGTSAGSPQWAAIMVIVDQGRTLIGEAALDGANQTIPDVYALPSSDFNPISGSGKTGLGSPKVEKVVSALVGGGITSTSNPGVASQLAFIQQPTSVAVGNAISPAITVEVEDSNGNVVTSNGSSISVSVASGPGSLSGGLTASAINGTATFSNVSLTAPGTYKLTASDGPLGSATSSSFTVTAPMLVFTEEPTATVASAIAAPVVVTVENASGNVVTSTNSPITVSIVSGPAGGTMGGNPTNTPQSGVATFGNLTFSVAGTYMLKATDSSFPSADSVAFAVTAPVLSFTQQPKESVAGEILSPALMVAIKNSTGNVVTSLSGSLALAIAVGPAGAVLGGNTTVSTQNGIATFNGTTLSQPGAYILKVTDGSVAVGYSVAITVLQSGSVDSANMNNLAGWAVDPTNPSGSIDVEVAIAGGPTQTFAANETRTDLSALVGSANHGFTYSTPVLSVGAHVASIYAVEENGTKVLLGTRTLVSHNSLFDEHYYLETNPDVAAAVAAGKFASGYDHFIEFGQFEGRSPSPYWDESWYLQQNPSVAAAVKAKTVTSGFMQYYTTGQYQNLPGLLYFNTSYYLANNADVAAAVKAGALTSAFEHYVLYGQYEGRSPMLYFSSALYDAENSDILPFITGESLSSNFEHFIEYGQYEGRIASNFYNEQTYLADNADVAAAVKAGLFKDGFQHWLEYGQYENRKA